MRQVTEFVAAAEVASRAVLEDLIASQRVELQAQVAELETNTDKIADQTREVQGAYTKMLGDPQKDRRDLPTNCTFFTALFSTAILPIVDQSAGLHGRFSECRAAAVGHASRGRRCRGVRGVGGGRGGGGEAQVEREADGAATGGFD
jgi:hypothetical protein